MTDQEKEVDRLKQRVAELVYAKEQLELRIIDLVMTRAKNALVTLTDEERRAVERASDALSGVEEWSPDEAAKDKEALVTLRRLLERLR